MRIRAPVAALGAVAALVVGAAGAKQPIDHAAVALNVLPPGESGSLAFPPTATDQAKLYDGLTLVFDKVSGSNYASYFKPETLGVSGKAVKVETPPCRSRRASRA